MRLNADQQTGKNFYLLASECISFRGWFGSKALNDLAQWPVADAEGLVRRLVDLQGRH
jgi:hypothetical protein